MTGTITMHTVTGRTIKAISAPTISAALRIAIDAAPQLCRAHDSHITMRDCLGRERAYATITHTGRCLPDIDVRVVA